MRNGTRLVFTVVVASFVAACGGGDTPAVTVTPGSVPAGSSAEGTSRSATISVAPDGCADVIAVEVTGDGPYDFAVTVSSPDTGWDKYADEWRVVSESGEVLGVRELAHPHADEQPFTRSLGGVEVPDGAVVVAARDSVEGYCGETMTVSVGD